MSNLTKFHIHSINSHGADIDHVLLFGLRGHVLTFYLIMLQITRGILTASGAKWDILVASEATASEVAASEVTAFNGCNSLFRNGILKEFRFSTLMTSEVKRPPIEVKILPGHFEVKRVSPSKFH